MLCSQSVIATQKYVIFGFQVFFQQNFPLILLKGKWLFVSVDQVRVNHVTWLYLSSKIHQTCCQYTFESDYVEDIIWSTVRKYYIGNYLAGKLLSLLEVIVSIFCELYSIFIEKIKTLNPCKRHFLEQVPISTCTQFVIATQKCVIFGCNVSFNKIF